MDPFDEFEFKPLTEGLGFHKKATQSKSQVEGLARESLSRSIPAVPPALSKESTPSIKPGFTLPHTEFKSPGAASPFLQPELGSIKVSTRMAPTPSAPSASALSTSRPRTPPVPTAFRTQNEPALPPRTMKRTEVGIEIRPDVNSHVVKLEPVAGDLLSGVFDAIAVVALATLFLVALLMVTKSDLRIVAQNALSDGATQLSLLALFMSVVQLYMVLSRSFCGSSLGEWAFDLQVGTDGEQQSAFYPLQVLWRCGLVMFSGFIFPILSLIAGHDLLAGPTGLRVYKNR